MPVFLSISIGPSAQEAVPILATADAEIIERTAQAILRRVSSALRSDRRERMTVELRRVRE